MSISHLSLVNQKLAFAGAAIDELVTAFGAESKVQKLRQLALRESVVFYLIMAMHFYVRELAEYHRFNSAIHIKDISDLHKALVDTDNISLEVLELIALRKTPNSWVAQLEECYEGLFRSPAKLKEKKAFTADNMIELTHLSEEVPLALTNEMLYQWLNSFRTLTIRHREINAEF